MTRIAIHKLDGNKPLGLNLYNAYDDVPGGGLTDTDIGVFVGNQLLFTGKTPAHFMTPVVDLSKKSQAQKQSYTVTLGLSVWKLTVCHKRIKARDGTVSWRETLRFTIPDDADWYKILCAPHVKEQELTRATRDADDAMREFVEDQKDEEFTRTEIARLQEEHRGIKRKLEESSDHREKLRAVVQIKQDSLRKAEEAKAALLASVSN